MRRMFKSPLLLFCPPTGPRRPDHGPVCLKRSGLCRIQPVERCRCWRVSAAIRFFGKMEATLGIADKGIIDRVGLLTYWQETGPPDFCAHEPEAHVCQQLQ